MPKWRRMCYHSLGNDNLMSPCGRLAMTAFCGCNSYCTAEWEQPILPYTVHFSYLEQNQNNVFRQWDSSKGSVLHEWERLRKMVRERLHVLHRLEGLCMRACVPEAVCAGELVWRCGEIPWAPPDQSQETRPETCKFLPIWIPSLALKTF